MWAYGTTPQVHVDLLEQVGPTMGQSEHSRKFPVLCRKNLELFRNPKIDFLYMNLILRTIPDLLVMSRIPSETLNKLRTFHNSLSQFYPSGIER